VTYVIVMDIMYTYFLHLLSLNLEYLCSYCAFLFIFLSWCSPEHPLMRARGRSILGGEKQSFQEYTESGAASRFVNCAILGVSSFMFLILSSCH
jgi:hypothetical protein